MKKLKPSEILKCMDLCGEALTCTTDNHDCVYGDEGCIDCVERLEADIQTLIDAGDNLILRSGTENKCANCGIDLGPVYCPKCYKKMHGEPENKAQQLCKENENFIQNKFGYCFYTLDSTPFIYNLYVYPQYRRCGHSCALLELTVSEIRKSGYDGKILIQAMPRENSIRMADLTDYYKRMGLVIYEARRPEVKK